MLIHFRSARIKFNSIISVYYRVRLTIIETETIQLELLVTTRLLLEQLTNRELCMLVKTLQNVLKVCHDTTTTVA